MNELHLFAGAGGGILGGMLLGHTPVCAVEIEPYPRSVLLQRQRDGILPRFPIWDDVCTFDGKPWRGIADVVCGGFPCQDISVVGTGKGLGGTKSGLWSEMARIIREVGPRFVVVENSAALAFRGLDGVLGDLASMGFDAVWGVFSAGDVGARHRRERMWIVADAVPIREWRDWSYQEIEVSGYRPMQNQPEPARVADDVARRVDRINAIGNGQVPAVVRLAWNLLSSHTPDVVEMENAADQGAAVKPQSTNEGDSA